MDILLRKVSKAVSIVANISTIHFWKKHMKDLCRCIIQCQGRYVMTIYFPSM